MTNITDTGHKINTEPELEFAGLVEFPKLSAAEIIGNVYSWIESDVATEAFDRKKIRNATQFEMAMIRRDALLEVKKHLDRLNAVDFV